MKRYTDKHRLDFLQRTEPKIVCTEGGWWVSHLEGPFLGLRNAIDAAILESEK